MQRLGQNFGHKMISVQMQCTDMILGTGRALKPRYLPGVVGAPSVEHAMMMLLGKKWFEIRCLNKVEHMRLECVKHQFLLQLILWTRYRAYPRGELLPGIVVSFIC